MIILSMVNTLHKIIVKPVCVLRLIFVPLVLFVVRLLRGLVPAVLRLPSVHLERGLALWLYRLLLQSAKPLESLQEQESFLQVRVTGTLKRLESDWAVTLSSCPGFRCHVVLDGLGEL